jgi:two-component system NtrC family sensor kinase
LAPENAGVRGLNAALMDLMKASGETVLEGAAPDLLGGALAETLGWQQVLLVRMTGAEGEPLAVLCLADAAATGNREMLRAMAGHAAVALENARLFSRIAQSNRQWAEVFDAIGDFLVVHDGRCNVLRVNRSLAEFVGTKPAELVGTTMQALLSAASGGSELPCLLCREKQSEFILPLMDRTYLVSTCTLHAGRADGPQLVHILKDITDTQEAERRYRELFDNIQEGLFFSTPEGRFVEVNEALIRMLGYSSRDELLQMDIPTDLYAEPNGRARFRQAIEEQGSVRNWEEALRRKDGSILHTLQNAFAVRDSEERIVQYRGLLLDITDLKRFQAQLQRERDFNSKILENTQSMILVTDREGQISYANSRTFQATLYQPEHVLNHRITEFTVAKYRDAVAAGFASTASGQQVNNLELEFVRADGMTAHFSANLSPMRDEQGNIGSIVIVMTDVSEAMLLQAKLMNTEKLAAVGQLVSGVAHEVNNPLTAILGFSDLLLNDGALPDNARKDLRLIVQEAQRTKTIVQNLLSFARQVPPQREPVYLNSIIRRTVQLRSYDLANHGVEVIETLLEPLPTIIGDSHQLQQVCLNILNNAYDAVLETGRPPRIEIITSCTTNHLEIMFRDNGPGILYPERVFDPFFTTKDIGKGTGLGLSICYGIVRQHGGEIACHNNPDGSGATFIVRLPLRPILEGVTA